MTRRGSVPTRVAADLIVSAEEVAASENRSTAEQINHWARIGMEFERSASVDMRRAIAAAAGRRQFRDLDDRERALAHALLDADIAHRVSTLQFGPLERAVGHATVSIDEDGELVEIAADGTVRRL